MAVKREAAPAMAERAVLDRYRTTLYSMERMVRGLRVELEGGLLDAGLGVGRQSRIIVPSALDSLLSTANPIDDLVLLPRQDIVRGVSCSYNHERGGTRISARCVSFEPQNPQDTPTSCLVLAPAFNPADMPTWMTLETSLDVAALNKVKALDVQFVSHFRHLSEERLGNFQINFRVSSAKGSSQTYADHCHRSFPSMTVPLEFTYSISEVQWAEIAMESATEAKILINLPLWSDVDYSLAFSCFEVSGPRRF